jgi:glycosyltransferase involved in cell wall biosynthesis
MNAPSWTRKVHVVHFTTVHRRDDTRIFSKECLSLARAGFSVTLLAPGDGRTQVLEGVTCRSLRVPRSRFLRMTLGQLRMLAGLLRLRADIYHFHDPELLPAALILRVTGRRVVFDSHEHISKDLGEKAWLPLLARRAAAAVGRAIEYLADRFMSGVVVTTAGMSNAYPTGRTAIVRNLPRLDEFTKIRPWSERDSAACYVGLVSEVRGSRQIARLAARVPARIVVAGPLSPEEARKLQQEPGWPLVEYRGVLDRGRMVSLLSEVQVGLAILLPMQNFEDSIPTKMLEYMAAGIPVVASNFASWRSLVGDCDSVVFIDPRDEDALTRAVSALLDNPERARQLGQRGREFVHQRFDWEQEFQTLFQFYAGVLGVKEDVLATEASDPRGGERERIATQARG